MGGSAALRVFCWVGAIVDTLAVAALLSPALSRIMLGVDVPVTPALLYAMRTGAALMLGWTLLLLWASFRPVERRAVVLLTVVPVILGFAATEIVAVHDGFVPAANAAPLVEMQVLLGIFGVWAWRRARAGNRRDGHTSGTVAERAPSDGRLEGGVRFTARRARDGKAAPAPRG